MTDELEKVGTRCVDGGYVNAECFPDVGQPDWKAECERLDAVVDALEVERYRLLELHEAIRGELDRPDEDRKYHGQIWCIRQRVNRALSPDEIEELTDRQYEARFVLGMTSDAFRFAPTKHAHSIEEANAGILHDGERCDQCPASGRGLEVTYIDRERGVITLGGKP